ncbi:MAG: SRPBCC domain-containing protein [SAR324 cluster bacterium]|nr:SRPBCC domain-containing protein [SAR324 cluster bacterium]
MENAKIEEDITLRITRTYPAPPERVYKAWTDLEELKKWFGPKGTTVPEAELDLRVGGRYRITIVESDGTHIVGGEYQEISPPHRLVFTWKWEHEPEDSPATLVTVEFVARDYGTELMLTHERFPSADVRDLHDQGWSGCLDGLAEALAA